MKAEVFFGNKVTVNDVIDFTMLVCGGCGIPHMMPTGRYNTLREEHGSFYCPNGCSRVFSGKSETEKLKAQLEDEKNRRIKEEERLYNMYLDELNAKNKLTKQLKRVHNGTCPCCKRSFANLKRHMETKHPDILKQAEVKN